MCSRNESLDGLRNRSGGSEMFSHRFSRAGRISRASAVLISLALIGCSSVTESSVANSNRSSNANATMTEAVDKTVNGTVDERLVSANTKFGLKLFAKTTDENAGKNVFISPASVGLALAMAYNGAEAETKEAMARALEVQGLSVDDLNQAYGQLRQALESPDSKVRLNIANSLWARKDISFLPTFIQRNQQYFNAEVTALDFNDPTAASTINSWVSGKTNGKIDKIVGSNIDPQTVLFLINAIYFKGTWTNEFDKGKTKEEPFTTGAGSQKRHPMMHQSGKYNYYENGSFQAVSLPYGAGRVSMYIFLPAEGTKLDQFRTSITAANWDLWMKQFTMTKGEIAVPRFRVEFETGLNNALKALGMGVAFDPDRANFKAMVQGSVNAFISQVKHKTFAEVNEEGTEAAAATSVEMAVTSVMRPPKTFQMIVDRPFVCAIRDNKTGTVLFLGSIVDPQ